MGEKAYTNSFAKIYDDIMSNVPYDLWYKYVQEITDYYGINYNRVLDLACGTGNMSLRFAKNGYEVTGIDRSGSMLYEAKKKVSNYDQHVNFMQADITNFEVSQKFDLAFSLFDSLNYVLSLDKLQEVFKNTCKALSPEGLFIFDMNTMSRLMSIEPGTTMLTGENYTCFWQDIINKREQRWQVKLKIYFDDEREQYFEEFHEETSYSCSNIKSTLMDAGFSKVDIYKAYTFETGDDDDNRLYFVCLKNTDHKQHNTLYKLKKKLKWRFTKMFMMI